MLTKNAKKIILNYIMNSRGENSKEPNPTTWEITLTNISGSEKTTNLNYYSVYSFINSLNHMMTAPTTNSVTFIRVGTGTTEATEDDYKLENYATGLTCDSVVTAISSNYTKTYTATFSNTTDADISVTEIGFFTNCYYYTSVENDNFLLDRIVLDTPITIPAGESKSITYELGF